MDRYVCIPFYPQVIPQASPKPCMALLINVLHIYTHIVTWRSTMRKSMIYCKLAQVPLVSTTLKSGNTQRKDHMLKVHCMCLCVTSTILWMIFTCTCGLLALAGMCLYDIHILKYYVCVAPRSQQTSGRRLWGHSCPYEERQQSQVNGVIQFNVYSFVATDKTFSVCELLYTYSL